jgi:hypothetical protein
VFVRITDAFQFISFAKLELISSHASRLSDGITSKNIWMAIQIGSDHLPVSY